METNPIRGTYGRLTDRSAMRAALDQAATRAFQHAVRRARVFRHPMVFSEGGRVVEIDPFTIPLPEDAGARLQ